MSNKRRDRATQLVIVESSVDFTKHTLLSSAQEHEQIDSANETTEIVAHKLWSAVNCPTKVAIVPLSWLLLKYLSISQSSHRCQHTNRQRKNETIVIVTDKFWSAVNCPITVGIVPFNSLALRYLLISQSTHCYYQHTNTNRNSAKERIVIVTHKV